MKLKKLQANQKTHGWPEGEHPTVQLPKYMKVLLQTLL